MYSAAFFLFWFGNDWKNMAFGLEMHKKYWFFGLEMKIKLFFINLQSCTSMEDEVLLRWSVKLYYKVLVLAFLKMSVKGKF